MSVYDLPRLRELARPFVVIHLPVVDSTNDYARDARLDGRLFAPAVVVADRQTAGRGRAGKVWHAPPGVLTFSIVLPAGGRLLAHHLPLIAGLAVRRALAENGLSGVVLKWPNDLLQTDPGVDASNDPHDARIGRKLAGLLCERFDGVDVIGVGLNHTLDPKTLPPDLRHAATSWHAAGGPPLDPTDLIASVIDRIGGLLLHPDELTFPGLLDEYRRHLCLTGRVVTVTRAPGLPPLVGRCDGVDADGRLRVVTPDGTTHALVSGTVRGNDASPQAAGR